MPHPTNSLTADGRAIFRTILVDVVSELPSGNFAATLKYSPEQFEAMRLYRHSPPLAAPTFPPGCLVLCVSAGACSHVGILAAHSTVGNLPVFEIAAWPLTKAVWLNERQAECKARGPFVNGRTFTYVLEVAIGTRTVRGGVRELPQADADHLRKQVGPVGPMNILEIFWSDAERHLIQANQAAQQRYYDTANALLASI